jgi:hypothetical protein
VTIAWKVHRRKKEGKQDESEEVEEEHVFEAVSGFEGIAHRDGFKRWFSSHILTTSSALSTKH